jgi:hypothetical protein
MNYVSTIRGFYHHLGLKESLTDEFFDKIKDRLVRELERRRMPFEVFF